MSRVFLRSSKNAFCHSSLSSKNRFFFHSLSSKNVFRLFSSTSSNAFRFFSRLSFNFIRFSSLRESNSFHSFFLSQSSSFRFSFLFQSESFRFFLLSNEKFIFSFFSFYSNSLYFASSIEQFFDYDFSPQFERRSSHVEKKKKTTSLSFFRISSRSKCRMFCSNEFSINVFNINAIAMKIFFFMFVLQKLMEFNADQFFDSINDENFFWLSKMIRFWNRCISTFDHRAKYQSFLHESKILSRVQNHNDFQNVQWFKLLKKNSASYLSFVRFQRRFWNNFQDHNVIIQRRWNVNNVIFWIITLIVHRSDFFFVYTSLFFRDIRQNLRVIINESESHKTKHLRFEYDIFVKKHNIFIHVLFFYMFLLNIIYFDEITQRQWIDDIVLSILQLSSFKNILQHHFRNYDEARTKIYVRNEIFFIVGQYDHCLNVIHFVSKFDLFVMWIEIIRLVNVIFKFRDIQLMIMKYDLKFTLQFSSLSFVRQQFTIFLNIHYHRIDVHMSSHECWLDVNVENVSISSDDCDITLLRKSFCLKHWIERFRNFRDNAELISSVFYSFMLIRNADFFSVEIKFNNSLRITNELSYHKTYNSNKNLFSIIMKNHQLFDSFYMKSLNFIQTKIDHWHVVNVRDSNAFVRSKK